MGKPERALTRKALSFIVKHKKDYEEIGQEDYSQLIFDVVREGVAIVNEVVSIFKGLPTGDVVFKKQFDERYRIAGLAIYNKEKTSLIRFCPESDERHFFIDCYVASNAFMDCKVEKVIVKDIVKSMGGRVFKNCKNLREVIFENGETGLDNNCFEGCSDTLVIKAPAGGCVEEYTKQYNLKFERIMEQKTSKIEPHCDTKERIHKLYEMAQRHLPTEKGERPMYDLFEILCEGNPKIKYNPQITKIKSRDAIVFYLAEECGGDDFIEDSFVGFVNAIKKPICIAYQGYDECMINTDALFFLYKI